MAQALASVGGSIAVLRRVLERFVQTYRDGAGPLDREKAHSLRGASAAIGAVEVIGAVQAFELAAARAPQGAELGPLAALVDRHLAGLVERLQVELARDVP